MQQIVDTEGSPLNPVGDSPAKVGFRKVNANFTELYSQVKPYSSARSVAAIVAVTSVNSITVGGSDGTFKISANVLVTTATTHAFTVTCAYTDEGGTARTATLSFTNVAGTAIVTSVANATGTVPYQGLEITIRAKAGTTITIATTGTFTSVVYNVEGIIQQVA
jgi:hypothetical protein